MTNDELNNLAREAGFDPDLKPGQILAGEYDYGDELRRFAVLVAEECAKVAEGSPADPDDHHASFAEAVRLRAAAAIRAKFKEPT